jgi:hypothetical protein
MHTTITSDFLLGGQPPWKAMCVLSCFYLLLSAFKELSSSGQMVPVANTSQHTLVDLVCALSTLQTDSVLQLVKEVVKRPAQIKGDEVRRPGEGNIPWGIRRQVRGRCVAGLLPGASSRKK